MAVTAPTRADFLARIPEFTKAPAALVDRCLLVAAARTRAGIYTTESEREAVCLKAAILLAKTSEGRAMKLADEPFIWQGELYELQRSATMGERCF